ncbi:uncharacterized protein BCR38DRAFT_440067 [Pseudomassariella vexata]|uniref:Secreted protein n=1 Tax=Pseudomassariella vexata TaxID=1141098 RepID=A0A1Y2DQD6_9PEZI|nr:uncharacterized protein BCR38DRAFT_440067 [Pseudomassariella vexata]ORY61399.1 hypothetical protein BCR38DRAFT_440067 [Pseudomassariella vexata]
MVTRQLANRKNRLVWTIMTWMMTCLVPLSSVCGTNTAESLESLMRLRRKGISCSRGKASAARNLVRPSTEYD